MLSKSDREQQERYQKHLNKTSIPDSAPIHPKSGKTAAAMEEYWLRAEEDRIHMLRHYVISLYKANVVSKYRYNKMLNRLRKEADKSGIVFVHPEGKWI